jgi:hypothetical protein
MPATGTTAAPLALARRAPGVAPHPWHPERAWLEAPSGRAARRFSARATPLGGRRAPGRCGAAGGRATARPGIACGRSPRPPQRAGRPVRGRGSHDRPCRSGPAPRSRHVLRAVRSSGFCTPAGAPARAPARSPVAPHFRKQARGDWSPLGPPDRAPAARGSVHSGPTPGGASPGGGVPGPGCCLPRTAGTTAGGLSCGPSGRPVLAPRPMLRPARPVRIGGVNPARCAPRRCAAGFAGGLTPQIHTGRRSKSPRHVVRTAPFPTGAGSRRGGAIRRTRSRATATPAPAGGASGEGRGRHRPGGLGTPATGRRGAHRRQARGARRPPWTPGPDGGPGGAGGMEPHRGLQEGPPAGSG